MPLFLPVGVVAVLAGLTLLGLSLVVWKQSAAGSGATMWALRAIGGLLSVAGVMMILLGVGVAGFEPA
ncbi:MAG: hypothetical protein AB7J35_21550 [Dehalococcoidia bacterium]